VLIDGFHHRKRWIAYTDPMATWYVDPSLATLIRQLKAKHPGMIIGTVGDASHRTEGPSSDHNPEADGSVDAIDPMIGPHFTKADCDELVNALVKSRDYRIKYLIWQRRIIAGKAGPSPWIWRTYHGTGDPHTGHAHLSRNDVNEASTASWSITSTQKAKAHTMIPLDGHSLPELTYGMDDDQYGGYEAIWRLQKILDITADGNYGAKTAAAVKAYLGHGDGKKVGLAEWVTIYGLSTR
jgi:hypothetical protein